MCLAEGETCSQDILTDVKLVIEAAVAFISGHEKGAVIDIAKLAGDMVYPTCPDPKDIFLSSVL